MLEPEQCGIDTAHCGGGCCVVDVCLAVQEVANSVFGCDVLPSAAW